MESLNKQCKLKKVGMRSGMWNVRILYGTGSLMKIVKELSKCKSNLVGVQEVSSEMAPNQEPSIFFLWKRQ
jgi:hypothetical protein